MSTALEGGPVGNGAARPGAGPRLITPEPVSAPKVHRLQVLPPAGSPGRRRGQGQRNPEHLALLKMLCQRYEQCFPSENEAAGTKPFWHDISLGDGSEESLFALATSFLELVDERLFPIHTELFMDELEELWLYLDGEIPVCAMGLSYEDLLWNRDLSHSSYHELYVLLMALAMRPYSELLDEALKRRFPQWTFPPGFDLFAIRNVLEKQALEEPLCFLVDAITLCARLSDNPFICIPPEDVGELPGWEDEEIAQLTDWWQEARVVHENACQLAQWVATESEGRLSQIVLLILEAHKKVNSRRQPMAI